MENNITFQEISDLLSEKYHQDTVMLIATSTNDIPSVRSIDTFYHDNAFWIVSVIDQKYVKEILSNKNVMISDGGHNRFWCEAEITGHPSKEQNLTVRDIFKKAYNYWYEDTGNEDLENVCYLKITPYKGYLHKNKVAYVFDKHKNVFITEKIKHYVDVKLQPFWD